MNNIQSKRENKINKLLFKKDIILMLKTDKRNQKIDKVLNGKLLTNLTIKEK